MNVGDLFQRLSFGEFANLSIGSDGIGQIALENRGKVVSFINAALTDLHTRFVHKIDFATLVLDESRKRYQLSAEFAESDTTPNNTKPRYIRDTAEEKFLDDVVRILAVEELSVPGVGTDCLEEIQWRLVSHDTIFVKNPRSGALLYVEYQARHAPLTLPANLTEKIHLAPSLESALELKVAASVFSSMDGEAQVAKSRLLLSRYEEHVQIAKMEGLLQEGSPADHDRILKGGWL